jgi:hypothetical protein
MREIRPMPWGLIDRLGDTPFMPEGRDQPAMPAGKVIPEPIDEQQRFDAAAWRAALGEYQDIPFMEDGRDQGTITDDENSGGGRS